MLTDADLARNPPDRLSAGTPTESFFPWGAWAERVKTSEISPMGADAFGEQVSLFDGRTSFSVTDIDIPGSDALPVRLGRTFNVAGKQRSSSSIGMEDLGGIGNWTLDVPYIAGVFDKRYPWTEDQNNPAFNGRRCSSNFLPKSDYPLKRAWSGNRVHVPGKGDRTMLVRDPAITTPVPIGAYVYVTADLDQFTCVANVKNPGSTEPREGFVMHSADGTVWTFDVEARRNAGSVELPTSDGWTASYDRIEVYLLASKIEDRHGNKVEYDWSFRADTPAFQPRLEAIRGTSASGETRTIVLGYEAIIPVGGSYPDGKQRWRLKTATAHGRIWNYSYYPNAASRPEIERGTLQGVELPDHSAWRYVPGGNLLYTYDVDNGWCVPPAPTLDAFSLTVTHPAGAQAKFEFENKRFFRAFTNGIGVRCSDGDRQPPPHYDAFSLTRKVVRGAGIAAPITWQYNITPGTPAGSATRTTTITQPDGSSVQHGFGNIYNVDEGRLYTTTTYAGAPDGTDGLRKETLAYGSSSDRGGANYPAQWGAALGTPDQIHARIAPVKSRTIKQDGTPFSRSSLSKDDFDAWARVVHETVSGSAGSKEREIAYHDNTTRWVLGQIASLKETHGLQQYTLNTNTYDSTTADLLEAREFGELVQSNIWYADGTLKSQTDGKKHETKFASYWRGIPRSIIFADDTTTMSATVDDWGQITSMTDPLNNTTSYEYYPAGRLKKISYPVAGNDPAWNSTSFTYEQLSGGGDFPCTAGMGSCTYWQSTRTTGLATETTGFDGLWRPRLSRTDVSGIGASQIYVRRRFDHAGRETFASYPSATAVANAGRSTSYDALGRVVATGQDSERGLLTTVSTYASAHKRTTTDARGHKTYTTFASFETPGYDTPVEIRRELVGKTDQLTSIARDSFGKILSITRSGGGHSHSASRSYTYNDQQRLCSVTEPESGTSVFGYDLAGNLEWRGKGGSGNCIESGAASQVVEYGYDALNRLLTTTFPSGTATISQDWYADGTLRSVTQGPVVWSYDYNGRRQITKETLALDGKTFQLDWTYSTNGHLSGLLYPDMTAVDFAPDALGRPSKAGSYASNVTYWPNGAMNTFTYGNNRTHQLTQNDRKLPQRSTDAGVIDFEYAYDANGNVTDIVDHAQAGLDTRSMTYDSLDRLETVTSDPTRWGLARFEYDGVDNLRKAVLGGAQTNYTINPTTNRLDALTGAQEIGYGYDTRGNVTSRAGRSFTIDDADRVIATSGDQGNENYLYDGLGRRVRITRTGNANTYQVYSKAGQLLAEQSANGEFTDYVYLNGSLLARVGGGGATVPSAPTINPAISTTGTYTVSWSIPSGSTSMVLLESVNGGALAPATPAPAAGTTNWTPVSARTGGVYAYALRACNANGCSEPGPQASAYVLRAPTGLAWAPNPVGASTPYTVKWTAMSSATGYRLEEKVGASWQQVYSGADSQFVQDLGIPRFEDGMPAMKVQTRHFRPCAQPNRS
ncbi:hypothetical protein [Dokdonella sp.]|uniref:RHS repeat domain-containing protein n=1 Tax=Dokdonella sp. TaxID=2291710 RepID=UPI0025C04773|nr:hypothetical protein [Dokdonella sp.]MBX3687769.1 RHS repeat protein [Dokdonella sp.]